MGTVGAEFMDTRAAAAWLGLSHRTLEGYRVRQLPHGRLVRVRELYTEDELKDVAGVQRGPARPGRAGTG